MTRFANGNHADDPLSRFRAGWPARAQKARNTWLPGTGPVEAAIEDGFRDGVKFAAESSRRTAIPSSRAESGCGLSDRSDSLLSIRSGWKLANVSGIAFDA